MACTKGCICNIAFGGINPATGDYFTFYETIAGGYGGTRRNDGLDAEQMITDVALGKNLD